MMIKEKLQRAWGWFRRKIKWFLLVTGFVTITLAFSQVNLLPSEINYPLLVNKPIEKLEYSYRSQELLRLEHNETGAKFRAKEITEKEWQRYLEEEFEPRSKIIGYEVARLRQEIDFSIITTTISTSTGKLIEKKIIRVPKEEFKKSTRWDIDIKNILK